MNDELRTYALDQMHHRIRQVRAYSLLAEGGSKITVHAALVKSDPPTVSYPANQRTLGPVDFRGFPIGRKSDSKLLLGRRLWV